MDMIRTFIALSLVVICLPLLSGCAPSAVISAEKEPAAGPRPEFEGWTKPQVALVLTGRQHGYIEPCGCTGLTNQKGGLARRHALVQSLRAKGWEVIPLDLGDQVRRIGAQAAIKFQSTIDAFRIIGYQTVGFGPDDLRISLGELIAAMATSTNEQGQSDLFVCANANPAGFVSAQRVIEAGDMRIGVTSVLGEQELQKVTHEEIVKTPPVTALKQAVQQLKAARCNLYVLLAHASLEESAKLAQACPEIDLVVTAGGEGEPAYRPQPIAGSKAVMIQVGTKGMHVGVVGVFDDPQQRIRYQRIALDARFQDSQEMLDILGSYQQKLQELGLQGLGLRPVPHPVGKFVGSETCGDCHTQANAKWEETGHHHATETLVHPGERSEVPRHHDPECLSCHVVGWNPQGYFPYETGYLDLEKSEHLHGVGCENCHGPGQAHVAAENGDIDLSDEQLEQLRRKCVSRWGRKRSRSVSNATIWITVPTSMWTELSRNTGRRSPIPEWTDRPGAVWLVVRQQRRVAALRPGMRSKFGQRVASTSSNARRTSYTERMPIRFFSSSTTGRAPKRYRQNRASASSIVSSG